MSRVKVYNIKKEIRQRDMLQIRSFSWKCWAALKILIVGEGFDDSEPLHGRK